MRLFESTLCLLVTLMSPGCWEHLGDTDWLCGICREKTVFKEPHVLAKHGYRICVVAFIWRRLLELTSGPDRFVWSLWLLSMTKNLKWFWLLHRFDKPKRLNEQWRTFILFQLLSGLDALENAIDAAQINVTEIASEVPLVQKQFEKNIEQLNITKKNALDAHDQSQTARKVRKGHYLELNLRLWCFFMICFICCVYLV